MGNIVENFLGYLRLNDDEEYDEDYFEDSYEEEDEPVSRKYSRRSNISAVPSEESTSSFRAERSAKKEEEEPKRERNVRMERTSNNKVIPIRTTQRGFEVCIIKPESFDDSQDICDMLLSGRAAIVNLEGFDPVDAQRIMDFISGCVYAINGKLHQISRYIFIFSPDAIDISGDFAEDLGDDMGFGVPTLSKEF